MCTFNQEKVRVGAFSVIVKTDRENDGSSAALLLTLSCTPLRDSGPSLDLIVGAMREGDTRTLPQPCRRWFKYTSSRILSQRSSTMSPISTYSLHQSYVPSNPYSDPRRRPGLCRLLYICRQFQHLNSYSAFCFVFCVL